MLNFLHDLPVLAIDSQEVNTKGADNRQKNLSRKWTALEKRAQDRKDGKVPPTRKQKLKLRNTEADFQSLKSSTEERNIKLSTRYIEDGTDLGAIVRENFSDFSDRMGIIGLHTCGNLTPSSLKIFFSSESAKFICNVGCCYHNLEEEFYTNPFLEPGAEPTIPGFPVSRVLRDRQYWLGRNARLLASQPLSRLAEKGNLPNRSLIWRAILQVIMKENIADLTFADHQVGRLAAKSTDFLDYARRAIVKIGKPVDITDDRILQYYDEYMPRYERKLNCFYQYRSLFAPLVEGIVLLDRLLYLEDHPATASASVLRLFDPGVSPRCYALIASKS